MSGRNFQMQSVEKKEEEDGRERVEKEGTVTNQRENAFIGNGEDYEVQFEGSLKSLPRSMIERERAALLKNSRSNAIVV